MEGSGHAVLDVVQVIAIFLLSDTWCLQIRNNEKFVAPFCIFINSFYTVFTQYR